MAEQWFTYSALGERLGISAEAVRQKAIRHRWRRQTANDGKTQVLVDVEEVRATVPVRKSEEDHPYARRTPDQHPSSHDCRTPVRRPSDARTFAALNAHIETLKKIVAQAEASAERERERAEQLDRDLDEERTRAAILQAEAAVVPTLKSTIELLRAALETEKGRNTELRTERDRLAARRLWWLWPRSG